MFHVPEKVLNRFCEEHRERETAGDEPGRLPILRTSIA